MTRRRRTRGMSLMELIVASVLLLGLLFVVLPLARLRRPSAAGERGRGRPLAGILLYFGAIGFGFIVVEIVLSQRFVLFLGHPVYSLAVILASMLFFSGIGSMRIWSGRPPTMYDKPMSSSLASSTCRFSAMW